MKKILFKCKNQRLFFYGDKLNKNKDFLVKSHGNKDNYNFLIFLDSRGCSFFTKKNLNNFFIKILKKKNYLIISRPLQMTTWSSLVNFIYLNKHIKFQYLITNMGFNDFTPKKKPLLKNVKNQINFLLKKNFKIVFLERFQKSYNKFIDLYSIRYTYHFFNYLKKYLPLKKLILINTPPLKKKIIFKQRKRPDTFFLMIKQTINFNKKIPCLKTINFKNFSNKETYDGVHYTNIGNSKIFNLLKKKLKIFLSL